MIGLRFMKRIRTKRTLIFLMITLGVILLEVSLFYFDITSLDLNIGMHIIHFIFILVLFIGGSMLLLVEEKRKQAEETLRDREEIYQKMFQNANDAIFLHEFIGTGSPQPFIEVNNVACQILEYTREELLSMSPRDIEAPGYSNDLPTISQEIYNNGNVAFDITLVSKSGRQIPYEINSQLFPVREKNMVLSIARDINERKQMEQIVLTEKEKYQTLVQNMEEGIGLMDANENISFVNPKLAEMFGSTEEELIGTPVTRMIVPEERTKFRKELAKRSKGVSSRYELTLLSKDGRRIPVQVSANPLVTETGEYRGSLAVFTDITEQKRFQDLQDRFISSTSHELRTPVTVIKGYIDFLRKHPTQLITNLEPIAEILQSNVERLIRLIENVLVVSKITQDIFRVSPMLSDLDAFVRTLQEHCLVLYRNRTCIINYFSSSSRIPILIDQDRILQVLHNLIANAIKNSPQASVVEIMVVRDPEEVHFSVQDYGVGIALPHFFQLFQPFSHFDTQYSIKGTGLGLYIVKNIVLAHGGRVEVLSQEHFGSSFTVTIPTS